MAKTALLFAEDIADVAIRKFRMEPEYCATRFHKVKGRIPFLPRFT